MIYLTIFSLAMMIALLAWCIAKASKTDKMIKTYVIRLLAIGIFTVTTQGLFFMNPSVPVAHLTLGLYYASLDALLIAFMYFVENYTEKRYLKRAAWMTMHVFATVDAVSLIANVFFHQAFELNQEMLGEIPVWSVNHDTAFFMFHLVFTYFMVMISLVSLVMKITSTPRFYRRKYFIIFILTLCIIIINGSSLVLKSPVDWSVYLYCIVGALLCYYALFHTPKKLIDKMLAIVVGDVSEAVFCFDIYENCVYTNKAASIIYEPEVNKKELRKVMETWREENGGELEPGEYYGDILIDGMPRSYRVSFKKLYDKRNEYIGCFFSLYDRTEEIARFKKEHYHLTHDRLTGLYNREYFFERAEKVLKSNPYSQYYMVSSNIKGFKLYNDLFGEEKGNEVLNFEAGLLNRDANGNVYGRISGDEFAILVPVDKFKEKIFIDNINEMKERFSNAMYQMHVYVGVYEINDIYEPVTNMCDKAKMAIEAHKGDYNTVVIYYDNTLLAKSLKERQLVGEIDRALDNKEFIMYLQPQFSVDNELKGAEALVRWQHPFRGLVFPGSFIEIFEETGLIYKLDRYMWELAVHKLVEWKRLGWDNLYISVNISAKDFECMDIYEEVTTLVERYGINPGNLKLEITETVLMTGISSKLELLDRLRRYGFIIEIDDFGSGYSSLNMLKNIQVDVVKIDMGFLREVKNVERTETILECMVQLIKNLKMEVITEGVETKEHVDMLTRMGCDIFQGYYFAKPMPVADFEEKYKINK